MRISVCQFHARFGAGQVASDGDDGLYSCGGGTFQNFFQILTESVPIKVCMGIDQSWLFGGHNC
jgi:hypothetical protein